MSMFSFPLLLPSLDSDTSTFQLGACFIFKMFTECLQCSGSMAKLRQSLNCRGLVKGCALNPLAGSHPSGGDYVCVVVNCF